jgi:2-dehydro-3-deoxyphosphogluconate aldolase/(4S)-4-hydroxy-2-oxoglutarate aldolase
MKQIGLIGLLPVAVFENEDEAVRTAGALIEGGLNVIEVTLRTDAGIRAIAAIKKKFPGMLVGAGTVLTVSQAKSAIEAGAGFIVSPCFREDLAEWCGERNTVLIPGCVTPSEIDRALRFGLKTLKFFPADQYGGIRGIQALSGPFPDVRFIPTGGISLQNLSEYTNSPLVHAIGGGWLCSREDIKSGCFDAIAGTAAQSRQAVLSFELAHIGINAKNHVEAEAISIAFARLLGMQVKAGSTSFFIDDKIEVNKEPGRGANGHIAIRTKNIERALYYMKQYGFEPDPESWKTDGATKKTIVYMKNEIGGFALHLVHQG